MGSKGYDDPTVCPSLVGRPIAGIIVGRFLGLNLATEEGERQKLPPRLEQNGSKIEFECI